MFLFWQIFNPNYGPSNLNPINCDSLIMEKNTIKDFVKKNAEKLLKTMCKWQAKIRDYFFYLHVQDKENSE